MKMQEGEDSDTEEVLFTVILYVNPLVVWIMA